MHDKEQPTWPSVYYFGNPMSAESWVYKKWMDGVKWKRIGEPDASAEDEAIAERETAALMARLRSAR